MVIQDNSPKDHLATRFPVSVKGVILQDNKVVLLKNEREEWELPGGKLEPSESPGSCLAREIQEELMFPVQVDRILDSWVYHITPTVYVLIVTYGCKPMEPIRSLQCSHEHDAVGFFPIEELPSLRMPDGYKQSIAHWAKQQTKWPH